MKKQLMKIPEVPSFLFDCGIPLPKDLDNHRKFQKNLLKVQVAMEDAIFNAANADTIVILDRGIMDTKGVYTIFIILPF